MTEYDDRGARPLALVVDDDQLVRTMVRDALVPFGFRVAEAENCGRALELFSAELPQLVLLDVVMPDKDGFAACQQLRRLPGGECVPVLMMTSLENEAAINRAYDVGATDFVSKPINMTALGHHARYLLRSSRLYRDLKNSESHLASAQRIARIGDWEWDLNRGEVICSPQLAQLLGAEKPWPTMSRQQFLELICSEDRRDMEAALTETADGGDPIDRDFHIRGADGRRYVMHTHAQLEWDGGGEPARICGIFLDVTSHKRLEVELQRERQRAEEQIARLGHYDSLTSLPNRYLLEDRLSQVLTRTQRQGGLVATLFLDLDLFKRFNESFGHGVGDRLLKMVARRLSDCLRSGDTIARAGGDGEQATLARLGGDEFSLLLVDMERAQDVVRVVRRVQETFSQPFLLEGGQEALLTASIGIALAPDDGEEAGALLKHAEVAMYHAKSRGGGSYQFYNESMNARASERILLEGDLKRALDNDEFELYYQPQVDIRDGRVVGVEALARWNHPHKGLILPGQFITLASETGLIDDLVAWTMRQACRQNMAWQKAGYRPIRMCVNVPSRQFIQRDLKGLVSQVIAETGHLPTHLELELTEETVMAEEDQSVSILKGLRELGLSIAIDDFGTGYSSLSYLKSFPLDTLKIDMSFLKGIPEQQDNVPIVRAIIAMGQSLNLRVLAEGVEREEQLHFLREEGCDEMQGYLFSRPVTADKILPFLDPAAEDETLASGLLPKASELIPSLGPAS